MTDRFTGAWPALITPSTPESGVDFAALEALVATLMTTNVAGLYLCGSTGEGTLLSPEERFKVTEAVSLRVAGRLPIIVHVGSNSSRDAVALAKHASDNGAAAVSAILPIVQTPVEAIYQHYQAIAAAAPSLPFFPYLFGSHVDAVPLMQALLERIPNLAGAKYTGPNMYALGRLVELGEAAKGEAWTIFSGMDEQCLFGMMVGAKGNIGSTLNLMPGAYRQMRDLFASDDLKAALTLQERVNRVTTVLISYGFAGALREALKFIGLDCGSPRLPHLALAADKRQALHQELEQVGLLELTAL